MEDFFIEDSTTANVVKVEKTGEIKRIYNFIVDGLSIFFVDGIAVKGYSEE